MEFIIRVSLEFEQLPEGRAPRERLTAKKTLNWVGLIIKVGFIIIFDFGVAGGLIIRVDFIIKVSFIFKVDFIIRGAISRIVCRRKKDGHYYT